MVATAVLNPHATATAETKLISSAQIIPIPADGLCMYHCVQAGKDIDWMKHRNIYIYIYIYIWHLSRQSQRKQRRNKAQALRRSSLHTSMKK